MLFPLIPGFLTPEFSPYIGMLSYLLGFLVTGAFVVVVLILGLDDDSLKLFTVFRIS